MAEILGAKSFLMLATEDLWGNNPEEGSGTQTGAQDFIHVPVDEYSVRFRPENRQSSPYIGLFQRKHSKNFRGLVQGNLRCPLYGAHDAGGVSLAEYLISWGFENHEDQDMPSKTAYWAEGPNTANKQHNGLRVNSATISGSEQSGFLELNLDLMGKNESDLATAESLPDDRNKLVDFEFFDVTCTLNSTAVNIESFNLQVQHNLRARFLDSFTPSHLFKTQRVVTLEVTLVKDSNTYDGYRRATTPTEFTGQLTFRGLHNGTGASGTYSKCTIDFNRLAFVDADDNIPQDDLAGQPVRFACLKPDSASNDLTLTWSLE